MGECFALGFRFALIVSFGAVVGRRGLPEDRVQQSNLPYLRRQITDKTELQSHFRLGGRRANKGSKSIEIDAAEPLSGIDLSRAGSFRDADGNKSMRATFARALSNALGEAQRRHKGGGVFDFTDSSGAKDLETNLRGLMIGNPARRLCPNPVHATTAGN
jgi:hypothetical protein